MDKSNKSELLSMISEDQVNHLQFYEYIEYLHNEDPRFGYYGYYHQSRLVAIQFFSPLNTGISFGENQYIPLLEEEVSMISSTYLYGPANVLSQFKECSTRKPYLYHYGFLNKKGEVGKRNHIPVTQATFDDIQAVTEFYRDKEIMIEVPERLMNIVKKGSVFLVKEASNIQSIALAHSETSNYALIGGVYTSDDARGKGYAYACCQALVDYLTHHHKTPYLFYDSTLPHLDTFYRSLGFTFTEQYMLLY